MNVCVKFPALRRTVILLCSLLVACASLLGTQEREIPLIVLQQSLQKKFPFNHRYLIPTEWRRLWMRALHPLY